MKKCCYQSWRFIADIGRRFYYDDCSQRAASLTFTSLLSIVPLMVLGLSILTAFPNFRNLAATVSDFVFRHFVASSGRIIQNYVEGFVAQASHLSFMGLLLLFIAAIAMLFTLEQTFNHIWRVPKRRHGVSAFLMYWAILTISPVLLGTSLLASSYVASWRMFTETAVRWAHYNPILSVTPFVMSSIAFTFLYVAIPHCKVPLRSGVWAGITSAVMIELAKRGFTIYIAQFSTYELIYGTLSSIPIFLLWVYLSWLIILFGAELSYGLTYHFHRLGDNVMDPFTVAYRWVGHLWQAQVKGVSLTLSQLVALEPGRCSVEPEQILQQLHNAKLIVSVGNGAYVLARDMSNLSFQAFCELLPWKLPLWPLSKEGDKWQLNLIANMEAIKRESTITWDKPMLMFYD